MSQEEHTLEATANFEFAPRTPITATFSINQTGTDKNYTHHQDLASDTWVIEHNMGKCPSVTVVDSAGEQVIADVQYISLNKVVVNFMGAFAGVAYLN